MAFCSRCGTQVQQGAKFCPSCGLDLVAATTGGGTAATQTAPAEKSEFDIVKEALHHEYELIKELGRGGMAIVFKARDKSLDREVAIKVLPFSLAFDKDFVERFQREAKTSAKLEHPNIIPIYRVGRTDKIIYFVMKFLRGTSLSDAIEKEGPLQAAKIRQLLSEAARALHYAHQHGIVHRDIKPDNIMFDELGHAIVTDFGIAKAASGTKLTGTGMSIGTPHYMSPEQARAQPLDGRSDIYSLGVVGFQCLTGAVPFDGEDSFSIGYKHIMEELPTPQLRGADQRDLFEIIRRMMAKSPDERFQSAEQLAQVLEGKAPLPMGPMGAAPTVAMKAAPTTLTPVPPPVTTPTTPIPRHEAPPRPSRAAPPAKKRSGVLVGFFLVLFLGGGGGGAYWYFMLGPGAQPAVVATPTPVPPPVDSAAARDSAARVDSATKAAPPVGSTRTTGTLTFAGVTGAYRVRVNGALVPDLQRPHEVDPGSKRIEVQAAGYQTHVGTIAVGAGQDKVYTVPAMVRLSGATGQPVAGGNRPPPPVTPTTPANQCETPANPNYNADNSCFHTRPVALDGQFVPLPEGTPAWPTGSPQPSIIYVNVTAEGQAARVMGAKPSNDPVFHIAAMQYARSTRYKPATKDGQPVSAWVQIPFLPKR